MRNTLAAVLAAAMLASGAGTVAGEKIVKLAVENMTCASCPYIVRQSLTRVDGVQAVDVSLEEKKAVVHYDDTRTSVEALTAATRRSGFPSSVIE